MLADGARRNVREPYARGRCRTRCGPSCGRFFVISGLFASCNTTSYNHVHTPHHPSHPL